MRDPRKEESAGPGGERAKGRRAAAVFLGLLLCVAGKCQPIEETPPVVQTTSPAWTFQQRTPTSSHLRTVDFVSATTGWIAGDGSTILKTTDSGVTWQLQEHSPKSRSGDIRSIDGVGAGSASAVGDAGAGVGRWWQTADGVNWTTPDVGATGFDPFTSVDMLTATEGYALAQSGLVRRMGDGATLGVGLAGTWNAIRFPVSATIGYAVGNGGLIRKTVTSATSWGAMTPATANDLFGLDFISDLFGIAVGAGGALVKTPDGTVWALKPSGVGTALRGIDMVDATIGYACGDAGVVIKTVDGGETWSVPQATGTSVALFDIAFVDSMTGFAVGEFGTVLKTVNGGTTWSSLTGGSLATFNAVAFDSTGTTGYAVGNGGVIVRTADCGTTWTSSPSGTGVDLHGVTIATDGLVAYACGDGGVLIKTANGGTSWGAQVSGTVNTLWSIFFPQTDVFGYCCGDGGVMLHTTDGVAWNPQTVPVVNLRGVHAALSGVTAYACGDAGTVLQTMNSGLTWNPIGPGTAETFTALQALPGAICYCLTNTGTMRRTFNDGTVWDSVATGSTNNGFAFTSSTIGIVVDGSIRYTSSSGSSFSKAPEHTTWTLRGAWFQGQTGYVVGDNGTILKTTSAGQ